MIIGVSGRGGSGKSTLSKKIVDKYDNFIYIDVDNIIETKVLKSTELVEEVNRYFSDSEYSINDIVMSYFNKSERNNIIHKFFTNEVAKQILISIKENYGKNIVIDWFLLHEIFDLLPIDITILTVASREERIRRVKIRNNNDDVSFFESVDNSFVKVDYSKINYVIETEKNYDTILDEIINKKNMENKK